MDPGNFESYSKKIPERKNFMPETANALLYIKPPTVPSLIREKAGKLDLNSKSEYHISVIAFKNGKTLMDFLSKNADAEAIKNKIKEEFLKRSWTYDLLPEYSLIEKLYPRVEVKGPVPEVIPEHRRTTIVQKVKMDDLNDYYDFLSQITGIQFEKPPAHITLFSGSDYEPEKDKGIGIYSDKDFNTYLKEKI